MPLASLLLGYTWATCRPGMGTQGLGQLIVVDGLSPKGGR